MFLLIAELAVQEVTVGAKVMLVGGAGEVTRRLLHHRLGQLLRGVLIGPEQVSIGDGIGRTVAERWWRLVRLRPLFLALRRPLLIPRPSTSNTFLTLACRRL